MVTGLKVLASHRVLVIANEGGVVTSDVPAEYRVMLADVLRRDADVLDPPKPTPSGSDGC